jgi:hypothetical protein
VLIVVPRGVARRGHYGHAAIAMALTLWAIVREPMTLAKSRYGVVNEADTKLRLR